jgi:tRNA(Ile)-lysidine synthase
MQPIQSPALIPKLAAAWPPERWRDVTVLVAVSGGADSVALACALNQLRVTGEGRLILAHYNHRLRGEASDTDQAFVEDLARELAASVVVDIAPSLRPSLSPSSEAVLRDARYTFLARAADQHGARYVATAHTADDQVETTLHNILRGSGLAGVAGIPRTRRLTEAATLIRPLLEVTRLEVLEYLASLGKDFREDGTNAELHYTRNRIRHELLPLLEREFNPHVRQALLRLARIAGEADELLDKQVGRVAAEITRPIAGGVELPIKFLRHATDAIGRQLLMHLWRQMNWPLQDMSFEKWDELLRLARGAASSESKQPSRQMFPACVTAELDNGLLRMTRPTPQQDVSYRGTAAQRD